jgi:hypothetical protein
VIGAAVVALALGWSAGLHAQGAADNAALAESLFRHAKKLMQEGAIAEACPKFAESYRLDSTLGTLLNLAVCHEQEGRTATAWAELHDAAARAARNGERERAAFAREHADALEARLSRLIIRVSEPRPGLEVRLDDGLLGQAAWSTAMPVDPGVHKVDVKAPGHQSWSRPVTVAPGPQTQELVVPPLVPAVAAAAPPPPAPVPRPPSVETAVVPPSSSERAPRSSARLGAGWTAAVLGAGGVAAGSYFGLRTLSKQKIVRQQCQGTLCSATGLAADDDAHVAARWSNVGFAAGAVSLGAAAYLLLWPTPRTSTAWQVLPVAFDGPGLSAGRRW